MAKKSKTPRAASRSGVRGKAKDAGFEVEDSQDAGSAPMAASLETGLVFVTFVALLVGLILAQVDLASSYGKGLFG